MSKLRIAIYGTGNFANKTHIPNILTVPDAEIVAASDANEDALNSTVQEFGIHRSYADAHEMIDSEELDVLYSIVPAFARTDVEIKAAQKGIHIFSEKPQARRMEVAVAINKAIRDAGVISTVGFRERYRPIFQEARRILSDKRIVHCRYQSFRGLPSSDNKNRSWWGDFQKAGGPAFDWGVHGVDYIRFMTGQDVVRSQAFYHHPEEFDQALSCSFNMQMTNGATMAMITAAASHKNPNEPRFTLFYEGGCLAIHGYDRIEVNGETVWEWEGEQMNPWLKQDQTFLEAVRTGDPSLLLSDYQDGLLSLAPILAGWESADRGGVCLDIQDYIDGA